MIIAHANLSTRGQRYDWHYEWRHDHIDVHFRSKADWRHFEENFEKEHREFLAKHELLLDDDFDVDLDSSAQIRIVVDQF